MRSDTLLLPGGCHDQILYQQYMLAVSHTPDKANQLLFFKGTQQIQRLPERPDQLFIIPQIGIPFFLPINVLYLSNPCFIKFPIFDHSSFSSLSLHCNFHILSAESNTVSDNIGDSRRFQFCIILLILDLSQRFLSQIF